MSCDDRIQNGNAGVIAVITDQLRAMGLNERAMNQRNQHDL